MRLILEGVLGDTHPQVLTGMFCKGLTLESEGYVFTSRLCPMWSSLNLSFPFCRMGAY